MNELIDMLNKGRTAGEQAFKKYFSELAVLGSYLHSLTIDDEHYTEVPAYIICEDAYRTLTIGSAVFYLADFIQDECAQAHVAPHDDSLEIFMNGFASGFNRAAKDHKLHIFWHVSGLPKGRWIFTYDGRGFLRFKLSKSYKASTLSVELICHSTNVPNKPIDYSMDSYLIKRFKDKDKKNECITKEILNQVYGTSELETIKKEIFSSFGFKDEEALNTAKENEKMHKKKNEDVFKFMIHNNVVTFVDPYGDVATVKLMKGDTWSSKFAFMMVYLKNQKGYDPYKLYKLMKAQTVKPANLPATIKALKAFDDHHILDIEEIPKPKKGKMVIVTLDYCTGKYTITEKKCKR